MVGYSLQVAESSPTKRDSLAVWATTQWKNTNPMSSTSSSPIFQELANPKIVNSSTASSLVDIEQLTWNGGRRAEDARNQPDDPLLC